VHDHRRAELAGNVDRVVVARIVDDDDLVDDVVRQVADVRRRCASTAFARSDNRCRVRRARPDL